MYHWPFPEDFPWQPRHDESTGEHPDLRLALEVIERLRLVRSLRRQQISVHVQNRVVILTGTVSSPNLRTLAAAHAWRAPGTFDVCNRLDVLAR
jgi:osmotically-inducible protein OsmY